MGRTKFPPLSSCSQKGEKAQKSIPVVKCSTMLEARMKRFGNTKGRVINFGREGRRPGLWRKEK